MMTTLRQTVAAVIIAGTGLAPAAVQTPASIRAAYGFDRLNATGAGQTIAVIVAYNDPTAAADLAYFSAAYGLATPSLRIVNQSGGSTPPEHDPTPLHSWELETALDLQYAHAIAPGANLLLVQAESSTLGNLLAAVNYAKAQPGVTAVNMSFGGAEFPGVNAFDTAFAQPANHAGVSFVASSGDSGAELNYPAVSPNVLAVGGTTLNADGTETAWSGSGGGRSSAFGRPSYQTGVNLTTGRGVPDVSYDADPASGFRIYNQFDGATTTGDANFLTVGGTSCGSPQWTGLITLANEGRAAGGLSPLTSVQTLRMLYALYNTPFYSLAFRDIVSGSNGYDATVGYDFVTGLGSPRAEFLVPYLAGSIQIPEPAGAMVVAVVIVLTQRRRRKPAAEHFRIRPARPHRNSITTCTLPCR